MDFGAVWPRFEGIGGQQGHQWRKGVQGGGGVQGMTGEADRVPGGPVNDDRHQASDDSAGDGEGGGGCIKIII